MVPALKRPPDRILKSSAAYYYNNEAPIGWTGENHAMVFEARPHEIIEGHGLMPLKTAEREMVKALRGLKKRPRPATLHPLGG
jgi:hypothetical protein